MLKIIWIYLTFTVRLNRKSAAKLPIMVKSSETIPLWEYTQVGGSG